MHRTRPDEFTADRVFEIHRGGKIGTAVSASPLDASVLSALSTPGVALVAQAIARDPGLTEHYTWAYRLVAVISDGTAVLGLGDVGPEAALPVMEGKSALFKALGGLNSIPLVLRTRDVDVIVETLCLLRPSFGAVNIEDVSAPRCFELEQALDDALDCPVMHNDQHGTAIVVLAGLRSAAKLLDRRLDGMRAVVAGAGAAGDACARILAAAGVGEVVVLDSQGAIHPDRAGLTPSKRRLAELTNPRALRGGAAEVLAGADVFVGVSSARVPEEAIAAMAPGGIVFALSNPTPEVAPEFAARHAAVVATGRSDYPNQISNMLACPGVFRGALDSGVTRITDRMKLAAAQALCALAEEDLAPDRVVPDVLDPRVAPVVSAAVAAAADPPAVRPSATPDPVGTAGCRTGGGLT